MRRMLFLVLCGSVAATMPRMASAQETAEAPLEEIVVTGEFAGPGLWKVTRPDDTSGHTLWILGDPGPLPKGVRWKSRTVEARITGAQEILFDAGLNLTPDEKVGVFRGLSLIPAALKARRNPDEQTLQDVLTPELYARWQVFKQRYLGRDRGVEEWRPLFAAHKLQQAFAKSVGYKPEHAVSAQVRKIAEKNKIRQHAPEVRLTFKRDELRGRIKQFSRESLADADCLSVTLDLIETLADRELENARARAWSTGDLDALVSLPPRPNAYFACSMAILSSGVARDLVPADAREQVTEKWLQAVAESLDANVSTFAVLPFDKLTRADGYLARLRARGFLVEDPS